jgi:hypothetical protein
MGREILPVRAGMLAIAGAKIVRHNAGIAVRKWVEMGRSRLEAGVLTGKPPG